IALHEVTVAYAGGRGPALDRICLTISPGERIVVTGPSGAGKSTLLALLLRFVEPASGTITVGGTGLAALDLDEWRAPIARARPPPGGGRRGGDPGAGPPRGGRRGDPRGRPPRRGRRVHRGLAGRLPDRAGRARDAAVTGPAAEDRAGAGVPAGRADTAPGRA